MKDAAAQPPADEHPVDDQTIQNWSICARVPRRDTVSVRGIIGVRLARVRQ